MTKQTIRFGTDGWRAIIGDTFTFDNVGIVTQGVATYLRREFGTAKPVVIGYDHRFMADRFAHHAADILRQNGFSILMTQAGTPTPVVAFSAKEYNSAGALMFTASHNPPEYCGIKFIPHYAGPATTEITNALMTEIEALEAGRASVGGGKPSGSLEYFDPYEHYVGFIEKQLDFSLIRKHPLKVLYDSMYGVGQHYLPRIFSEKAGYAIDSIHDHRDPLFGGRLPEPFSENLEELIAKVPSQKYDVGLAHDGDADRFGVVDETGQFLEANKMLPLLYRYLHKRRGYQGGVVRTVATSMLVDRLAEKYGSKVIETPVGFKYVGDWMRKEPIVIGGEESGGISVLHHIPEKDGVLANLLVAEMIAVEQKSLSKIYEDMLDEADIRLHNLYVNLHLEDSKKQSLMAAMRELSAGDKFAGFTIQQINPVDGVKLSFGPYDWLLLRPSGTEPILRLYGESTREDTIPKFQEAVSSLMKAPA